MLKLALVVFGALVAGSLAAQEATPGRLEGPAIGQALHPDLMSQIQSRLAAQGYDVGTPDGLWGSRTKNAVMKFQMDKNITPTGQLTSDTLVALGVLGDTTQTAETDPAPASPAN